MSPFSAPVLGGAALVSAPALWSSLVLGTMPVAEGLLRYLVVVAVCWLGLSLVAALVGPPPRATVRPGRPDGSEGSANPSAGGSSGAHSGKAA